MYLSDDVINPYSLQENIHYKPRTPHTKISSYMDEVVDQIDHLDYYFEGEFEAIELIDFLKEDLPHSTETHLRDAFIEDVVHVCASFYSIIRGTDIRIQIEGIETDKCRLFHMDYIKQRLLCTYRGLGTEWLEDSNVNRKGLGKGDNQKIIKDASKIKRANPFDVLILKGDRFRKGIQGAVHRSPPIEHLQTKRVILKIDEL